VAIRSGREHRYNGTVSNDCAQAELTVEPVDTSFVRMVAS
jgi:hypothetical protein